MEYRSRVLRFPSPRAAGTGQCLTLEGIYREHFAFVYRRAARLAGPGIDAEDLAQEVFLIAERKLATYDGSSLISSWLYGITLNVVRAARRRERLRRLFQARVAMAPESPVCSIDRAELLEAHRIAYQILDQLSAKKREVFILAEFEGLGCDEIAKLVGTKTATVWSRLHYARQEFSRRLARRSETWT
jgi:RNA polymerase sigma-70 factor (ECF subfamily)